MTQITRTPNGPNGPDDDYVEYLACQKALDEVSRLCDEIASPGTTSTTRLQKLTTELDAQMETIDAYLPDLEPEAVEKR